jgi:hypothetical protein
VDMTSDKTVAALFKRCAVGSASTAAGRPNKHRASNLDAVDTYVGDVIYLDRRLEYERLAIFCADQIAMNRIQSFDR